MLGLKAEVDYDLASPVSLYLLVNLTAVMLRSLLLLDLLLFPLKSAKSHVSLVPLMEIWSLSRGNLEQIAGEFPLSTREQTSLTAQNARDLAGLCPVIALAWEHGLDVERSLSVEGWNQDDREQRDWPWPHLQVPLPLASWTFGEY